MDDKPQWYLIKTAYQNGEGSCRELAERFYVSRYAVEARCKREGWRRQKSEIAQKVTEKVVEDLVSMQKRHVEEVMARGERYYADLDAARAELLKSDRIDPFSLESLIRTEVRVDLFMRRALGLPDKIIAEPPANAIVGVPYQFTTEDLDRLNEARKQWMARNQRDAAEGGG